LCQVFNQILNQVLNKVTNQVLNQVWKPKKLQTNKGKEFVIKTFKYFLSHEIHWFSSESELKAQIVEFCFIDVLPFFVDNYNNSYHRSIKMKPIEAN
jgi:hypothetical protein